MGRRFLPRRRQNIPRVAYIQRQLGSSRGTCDPGRHRFEEVGSVSNFAVTLIHGPGWDDRAGIREQQGWDEHARFMDGLVAEGFLLLGGPVGDRSRTLHAVEAADEDEVRRRLAEDPWADAGLLEVGSIEPWALWLDFREQAADV